MIKDIQWQFHQACPFLKVEFFDKPHEWGECTRDAVCYEPKRRLKDIGKKKNAGSLEINAEDRAGALELKFRELFGLFIQVYRRQEFEWIETAGSDDLTLLELNEMGKKSVARMRDRMWMEREMLL